MDDDYFASLGGSLMKDLLADLQVDENDGWLSLDQLEQELAHMDKPISSSGPPPGLSMPPPGMFPPSSSAASMVVSHQQQSQHGAGAPPPGLGNRGGTETQQQQPPHNNNNNMFGIQDAWKSSLERFTASMGEDFLAADTVRKQQKQVQPHHNIPFENNNTLDEVDAVTNSNIEALIGAEEYDTSEKLTLPPPPGLGLRQAAPPPSTNIQTNVTENNKNNDPVAEPIKIEAQTITPSASNDVGAQEKNDLSPESTNPFAVILNLVKEEGESDILKDQTAKNSTMPLSAPTPQNSVADLSFQETNKAERVPLPTAGETVVQSQKENRAKQTTKKHQKPSSGRQPAKSYASSIGAPLPTPTAILHRPVAQHVRTDKEGTVPTHDAAIQNKPNKQQEQQQKIPQPQVPVAPGVAVPPAQPSRILQRVQVGQPIQPPQGFIMQQSVMPPPQKPMKAHYCNPLPSAPPIPAAALESNYMKTRDISYVIHSIMKPVLAAGVSKTDYHMQYFLRRSGQMVVPGETAAGKMSNDKPQQEMQSRAQRSKEWSSEKATLGHVAKTNIGRPRALIATPVIKKENAENEAEQKQRASLWKARIYNDQAYQSYLAVVEIWRAAGPGMIPPQLQPHLIKLMKCLGISVTATKSQEEEKSNFLSGSNSVYEVDTNVLKLFLKLNKGQVLLSRILDQALLPPRAVQALLPVTLQCVFENNKVSARVKRDGIDNIKNRETDDRMFRSWTRVVQSLPNINGNMIIQSIRIVQDSSKTALSSPVRMECVHSLLQRGTAIAADPSTTDPDYLNRWKQTEIDFMNLLSSY